MRYAYLGPEGTFTEAAVALLTRSRPAGDVRPVPCATIGATLAAVRDGTADRAVVPIESSVEGIVTATVDDLASGDVLIRGEARLPIEFALLAREGTGLDGVKTVGGHPQAEAQCRRWLAASLPGAEWVPFPSNAEAARRVGEGELDAALASAATAARYGLTVLAPDVHDRANAVTRFVEVAAPPGPLPAPTGADRTSLAAFLRHDHAGALMEILTEFAVRGISLSTIQSRPTGDGLGSYFFFIDCEGHIADARVGEAMMGVRRVCAEVRFLGSYPRSDGGATQVRLGTSDLEFAEAAAWLARVRYGRP
jgi:prephenate dehydratase